MANKTISALNRLYPIDVQLTDWLVCLHGNGSTLETSRISFGDFYNSFSVTGNVSFSNTHIDGVLNTTSYGDCTEWNEAYSAINLISDNSALRLMAGTTGGFRGALIDNSFNSGVSVTWHEDVGKLQFSIVPGTALGGNLATANNWINSSGTNSGISLNTNNALSICPTGHGRTHFGTGSIAGGYTHITGNALSVWGDTYISGGLTITQLGSGNALTIEDSTNPDTTPFIIDNSGNVVIGKNTAALAKLDVSGVIAGTSLSLTQTTGTSPLTVSSTTLVTNFNADLLDGHHASEFAASNGPTFTGVPNAPTASPNSSTTQIATTYFVTDAITTLSSSTTSSLLSLRTSIIGSAPNTLNTLAKLSAAINDDYLFFQSINTALETKIGGASPTLSGNISFPGGKWTSSGRLGVGTTSPISPLDVVGQANFNNQITAIAGIASSSTTTGTVVVTGGIGISGALYVGGAIYGNLSGNATTATTATTANALNTGNSYQVANLKSGRIFIGDGSPTTPSLTFGSDGASDTGIYWGGDGYINFTNDGLYSGQITPMHNLVMVGTITASNLSGTNTGDQTNISGNAATATNASNLTGIAGLCGYSIASAGIEYTTAGGPQVMSTSGGAAMLSFHRAGVCAVNFGLDTDNVLKVGGWSMGAIKHTIMHSGNIGSQSVSYATTSGSCSGNAATSSSCSGNAATASSYTGTISASQVRSALGYDPKQTELILALLF